MRILFVNSIQMFAGGEIWLLTTMVELQRRGHYVHLLCRPETELARKALARGLPVTTMQMRSDLDPVTMYQTWRLLRRYRLEAIITNMDKELRFAGLAARLAGIRGIFPRRGIDYPLKNRWRYRFAYNVLATRVIANSRATKKALLKNASWLKPERVMVIHNGIDPSPFAGPSGSVLPELTPRSGPETIIGFVGQLDERKGVQILLPAFAQLHQQIPTVRLLLVGRGSLEGWIRDFIRSQDLTEAVSLTGFRDDIVAVMTAIDVLVLPSFWEGFGIVLIEAMAAAKPVISTRVSSMPEIVMQGQTGLLVAPGNVAELANALFELVKNPALAARMGAAGRQRVLDYFNLDRMISELEQVLKIRD